MSKDNTRQKETAQRVGLSLYPRHIRTIRQFGQETSRTDSNAIQFIIDDWARMKRQAVSNAQPEAA